MTVIMKDMACYHDWEVILSSPDKFILVSFEELKHGDIVMSHTYTHSQKYMMVEGYEEYNCMKHGVLLTKNESNPEKSILYTILDSSGFDFVETNLYANPGSSGGFTLYKYID